MYVGFMQSNSGTEMPLPEERAMTDEYVTNQPLAEVVVVEDLTEDEGTLLDEAAAQALEDPR